MVYCKQGKLKEQNEMLVHYSKGEGLTVLTVLKDSI